MVVFNFYLFNRDGLCVCYREWRRERKLKVSPDEDQKIMFGMLAALRSFATLLSTKDGQQFVNSYATDSYRMNFLETATGLKFVLNTDLAAPGATDLLRQIHGLVADTLVHNPFVSLSSPTPIENELFLSRLDRLVQSHTANSTGGGGGGIPGSVSSGSLALSAGTTTI